ncbi:MAG: CdaR family protein [Thermovenabulum sp.]|uniref:CdaR family protein n=1 Tax=Thermovenabulum sp. TaxID=3100335 RepID=UPI003C7E3418
MRNILSNDFVLKVLSVLAALIMWMYVMNEQNPQVTYVIKNVPIKFVNLDTEKYVIKEDGRNYFVNVKVKARRSIIVGLKPEDISAQVNLQGRGEGDNLLPVNVTVPNYVELVDFTPKEILISLDRVIESQVNVVANVKGIPAEGYVAKPAVLQPQTVVIRGPKSVVDVAKNAVVDVDISGKASTVVTKLPVKVFDEKGAEQKNLSVEPDTVEVIVPIVKATTVSLKPVVIGNPLSGYIVKDIKIEPYNIFIIGNEEVIKNISELTTKPVDISQISTDTVVETQIIYPDGVVPVDENMKNARITIYIEKAESKELYFNTNDLEVRNLKEGYQVLLEEKGFVLTVVGPESMIEKVSKKDVRCFVDLSQLTEGKHEVKVQANVSAPYKIENIEPSTVKVTITRI